MKTIVHT